MAEDPKKTKPVDPSKPDPDLKSTCERVGHDPDDNGICRDCGTQT
jgi:hypothetical protein